MVAYLLAAVSWLILMARQIPCWSFQANRYTAMCYSDLSALYLSRGQATGGVPYFSMQFEYPVLTGYFAMAANWLAGLFGGYLHPGATGAQLTTNVHLYLAISAVMLFGCWLWLIAMTVRLTPGQPAFAIILACLPAVMTTGLINWDLLVVALTATGLVAWQRGRPIWAGLWLGLGVAAKLYPIVLLGALLIWCLRSRRLKQWALAAASAVVIWVVVNLPIALGAPGGWKLFYSMNATRGPDLGSIWLAISLLPGDVAGLTTWSRLVMIAGYLGLAGLILVARHRPTVAQIAYLAVAIMCVGNLVYSPQYVLWLAPLIVLVRPYLVDLVMFSLAELVYYVAIWAYLNGSIAPPGQVPWLYIGAIVLRVGVTVWLVARVVHDILAGRQPDRPRRQPAWAGAGRSQPTASVESADAPVETRSARPAFASGQAPRVAAQGWLASRLVLLIIGLIIIARTGWSWGTILGHWDVAHFVTIAEQGYTTLTDTAYFPGLPLVMALFRLIGFPPILTGTLLALVGSAAAAAALYRLAGRGVGGAVAVIAWSFAPMAIFGFVAYSEAPFCALGFWAWWYARRDRWGLAAGLAAGACLFRISGLFLVGALIILALVGLGRSNWRRRGQRLAWLGLPVAALASYEIFLKIAFGSWGTWFQAQVQGWGRTFRWPWQAWQATVNAAGWHSSYGNQAAVFRWEIVAIIVGTLVTIYLLWRARLAQAGYVGTQVLAFACQVWFISVARAMLVWFPVFTCLGPTGAIALTGWRQRARQIGLTVGFGVEAYFFGWWAVRFFDGAWAG